MTEARNLPAKDAISGTSNPFCTFYVKSRPGEFYNTSCRMKTVNPVWNDGNESNDFVLTLPTLGSVQDNDILHFDVWSFAAQDDKLKVSVID